jgi:hypothetical protein
LGIAVAGLDASPGIAELLIGDGEIVCLSFEITLSSAPATLLAVSLLFSRILGLSIFNFCVLSIEVLSISESKSIQEATTPRSLHMMVHTWDSKHCNSAEAFSKEV